MAIREAPHKGPGKGNRRTGVVRGSHSGLRRGTLEWHQDKEILERIERGMELSLGGLSCDQVAERLEVSVQTVWLDRKRNRELAQDKALGSLIETVGKLRWVQSNAEQAFLETKETSLNRSAYLNTYLSATTAEAKLLGQEPAQRLKVEGGLSVTAIDAISLGRPGVRAKLDALYDALDGPAEPSSPGPSGNGRILELPATPKALGAGVDPSGNGNGRADHHHDSAEAR